MPGTFLGSWETSITKTGEAPQSHGDYILTREDRKETMDIITRQITWYVRKEISIMGRGNLELGNRVQECWECGDWMDRVLHRTVRVGPR